MMNNKRGSVLVLALIIAVVVSVGAASLFTESVTQSRSSERSMLSTRAHYLTEAAVEKAIYALRYGPDVINNDGDAGQNGYPDLYEQLHGLNSFSVDKGGPGEMIDPPLSVSFTIDGQAVTVNLASVPPQYADEPEMFDYTEEIGRFLPYTGCSDGVPLVMDFDGDGTSEILLGTTGDGTSGEIRYYKYVEEGDSYILQEITAADGGPVIDGLNGMLVGNIQKGDINGNGIMDIVFQTTMGNVYCYEVGDAATPFVSRWEYSTVGMAGPSYWEPMIANLYNDSTSEVIMSAGGKGFYLIDSDGGLISWINIPTGSKKYFAPPLVGDFDRDGANELVGYDGEFVDCLELDGTRKWTYLVGTKLESATGALEIKTIGSKKEYVVDTYIADFKIPSPIMGDLDNDGYPELVVTSTGLENSNSNTHTVILRDMNRTIVDDFDTDFDNNRTEIINVPDDVRVNLTPSALAAGFNVSDLGELHSHRQPVIGDANGDGIMEIIHGSCLNQVYMFNVDFDNTDGSSMSTTADQSVTKWTKSSFQFTDYTGDGVADFPTRLDGSGDIHASPLLVNVDADPELELVFATMSSGGLGGSVIILDNTVNPDTGELNVWKNIQFPADESFYSGISIGDINDDGIDEIIMASTSYDGKTGDHYIYLSDLDGINNPRTIITAIVDAGQGVAQQATAVVSFGNPTKPNPKVTMLSWQE